jgi:hypothetical protein
VSTPLDDGYTASAKVRIDLTQREAPVPERGRGLSLFLTPMDFAGTYEFLAQGDHRRLVSYPRKALLYQLGIDIGNLNYPNIGRVHQGDVSQPWGEGRVKKFAQSYELPVGQIVSVKHQIDVVTPAEPSKMSPEEALQNVVAEEEGLLACPDVGTTFRGESALVNPNSGALDLALLRHLLQQPYTTLKTLLSGVSLPSRPPLLQLAAAKGVVIPEIDKMRPNRPKRVVIGVKGRKNESFGRALFRTGISGFIHEDEFGFVERHDRESLAGGRYRPQGDSYPW